MARASLQCLLLVLVILDISINLWNKLRLESSVPDYVSSKLSIEEPVVSKGNPERYPAAHGHMVKPDSDPIPPFSKYPCPVSTKHFRYAQDNIDTALFEHLWAFPLKCYGTFVELGAFDGKTFSNTKFFEDFLGWNGVLIEAYPHNFEMVRLNRPNTINYNTAICPPGMDFVEFIGKGLLGGIITKLSKHKIDKFNLDKGERIKVPCEPIGPLLRRSNITHIDLFSLDVEGAEMMVLDTMDWSIQVHVYIIEMENTEENNAGIRSLMIAQGFRSIKNEWDVNAYGKGNVNNEVFINPNYH